MVIVIILLTGLIVGFAMHFLLPNRFARIVVDLAAGPAGAAIAAIIVSPFSTPGSVGQKITFLIAAIAGAMLSVLVARAAKL